MVAVPRGAARHAAYCVVFRRATKQWDSANRALNKFAYALSVLMSKLCERTVRIDVAKYSKTDRVVNATYNLSDVVNFAAAACGRVQRLRGRR